MKNEYIQHRDFYFNPATPLKVMDILNNLYQEKLQGHETRVRVYYGDIDTGEVWLEEHDVLGVIGRSTGPQRIPLLVHNSRAHGGGGLLTHCILGVQCTKSKRWIYKADNFKMPPLNIETPGNMPDGHLYSVAQNNEVQASFKSRLKAQNYIDFMQGKRMTVG